MSSATPSSGSVALPDQATVSYRRRELKLWRALGIGTAIFLIVWGPLSNARWLGVGPGWTKFEAGFDVVYGVLLLLPYGRIRSPKVWRTMMAILAVASVVFVFVLVFDVLFIANLYVDNSSPTINPDAQNVLYIYADDAGPRLPLPVLNCALVFLALVQAPVIYFSRHPEQMD